MPSIVCASRSAESGSPRKCAPRRPRSSNHGSARLAPAARSRCHGRRQHGRQQLNHEVIHQQAEEEGRERAPACREGSAARTDAPIADFAYSEQPAAASTYSTSSGTSWPIRRIVFVSSGHRFTAAGQVARRLRQHVPESRRQHDRHQTTGDEERLPPECRNNPGQRVRQQGHRQAGYRRWSASQRKAAVCAACIPTRALPHSASPRPARRRRETAAPPASRWSWRKRSQNVSTANVSTLPRRAVRRP